MNPFEDDRFNEENIKMNPSEANPFDLFNVETPVSIYKTKFQTMTPRQKIDARHAAIVYHLKNGWANHAIVDDLSVSAGLVSTVRTAHRIAVAPRTSPFVDTYKQKVIQRREEKAENQEEFVAKVKELCKNRISCAKIAQLLSCGRDKIRYTVEKYGIQRSYFLGPAVAAEIRRVYKSGEMSQSELAQEYKVSVPTISQLLSGITYTE
jgi:DNA-binding XRE family transcriptional regulator